MIRFSLMGEGKISYVFVHDMLFTSPLVGEVGALAPDEGYF
jgi:hypothetical protein